MDISKNLASKAALAELSHNTCHHICIENEKLVAREEHYIKRRTREALEIEKQNSHACCQSHKNLRQGSLELGIGSPLKCFSDEWLS
jgi:hypothetical protein